MAEIEVVSLKKKVNAVLEIHGVFTPPPVRVGIALDVSGSTNNLYRSGQIQRLMELLFPVALRLDDDGSMELGIFGDCFRQKPPVSMDNYQGYISREVYPAGTIFDEGTKYAPVITGYLEHWFGNNRVKETLGKIKDFFFAKKTPTNNKDLPALLIVDTDGQCFDEEPTRAAVREAASRNIFIVLVGVGLVENFTFLRNLKKEFSNVDHVYFPDLSMTPDEMYKKLLSDKLCGWLKGLK